MTRSGGSWDRTSARIVPTAIQFCGSFSSAEIVPMSLLVPGTGEVAASDALACGGRPLAGSLPVAAGGSGAAIVLTGQQSPKGQPPEGGSSPSGDCRAQGPTSS